MNPFVLMIRRNYPKPSDHYIRDGESDGRTIEEELARLISIWEYHRDIIVEVWLLETNEYFEADSDKILIWNNQGDGR